MKVVKKGKTEADGMVDIRWIGPYIEEMNIDDIQRTLDEVAEFYLIANDSLKKDMQDWIEKTTQFYLTLRLKEHLKRKGIKKKMTELPGQYGKGSWVRSYPKDYWDWDDDGSNIFLGWNLRFVDIGSYPTCDWARDDGDGYEHLMRLIDDKWVDISKGKKCRSVCSYPNGDWKWMDDDGCYHLMRLIDGEWVDLTKNLKSVDAWSYDNGDWGWKDEYGVAHKVKQEKKMSENKTEKEKIGGLEIATNLRPADEVDPISAILALSSITFDCTERIKHLLEKVLETLEL